LNWLYTPRDIAIFLLKANFTLSDENAVLHAIWESSEHIKKEYAQDEVLFRRAVRAELDSFTQMDDETDELEMIMRDANLSFVRRTEEEQDYIFGYFKVIRLELMYIKGKDFHKIKLRRLLRQFGYKRRSLQLVERVNNTLSELSLVPYLRGYEPCDINAIGIDDMIMIRLK